MNFRGWSFLGGLLLTQLACSRTSQPSVDEGRALYRGNGCATCHGPTGHGDGPTAATLPSRPRDFRDVKAFKNGADETSIAATLNAGIEQRDVPPPLSHQHLQHEHLLMPRFSHLSERERRSLALYVMSFRQDAKERKDEP